ncbi:MAG: hypothetical protein US51_C0020G0005 [Microgenomates group bacterium GW2011_GWA2_37_6]|nr:MAG: hypothetical protein US51_C0020G0005 [Microgenomates group bacterium GW2011_GWA2_37_6]
MIDFIGSNSGLEPPPIFEAIIIPSYGMSKSEDNEYRLSFFSEVVSIAAFEMWKGHWAPKVIIEGAKIFPNDPKNDGNLIKSFLLELGMPEEAIIQRRNTSNTYNQLLDAKMALEELRIPQERALFIYSDLHKYRIPQLLKNYNINSEYIVAEDILSEYYPPFASFWDEIKKDPSYKEKAEDIENKLTKALRVDSQGKLARLASWLIFPFTGAEVPDVVEGKTVRNFAVKS